MSYEVKELKEPYYHDGSTILYNYTVSVMNEKAILMAVAASSAAVVNSQLTDILRSYFSTYGGQTSILLITLGTWTGKFQSSTNKTGSTVHVVVRQPVLSAMRDSV